MTPPTARARRLRRYLWISLVWTVVALLVTWRLPAEGPYLAMRIAYPGLGLLVAAAALLAYRLADDEPLTEENALRSLLRQTREARAGAAQGGFGWSCPDCGAPVGDPALIGPGGTTTCERCGCSYAVEPEAGS